MNFKEFERDFVIKIYTILNTRPSKPKKIIGNKKADRAWYNMLKTILLRRFKLSISIANLIVNGFKNGNTDEEIITVTALMHIIDFFEGDLNKRKIVYRELKSKLYDNSPKKQLLWLKEV